MATLEAASRERADPDHHPRDRRPRRGGGEGLIDKAELPINADSGEMHRKVAIADATGVATYYRITGSAQVWQGLCSDPWQGSKLFPAGAQVHNGGNTYRATVGGTSAASGGPIGTSGSITDGGVTWAYVQAGTDMAIDNASLNAGQQFTVTSCTLTQGGA